MNSKYFSILLVLLFTIGMASFVSAGCTDWGTATITNPTISSINGGNVNTSFTLTGSDYTTCTFDVQYKSVSQYGAGWYFGCSTGAGETSCSWPTGALNDSSDYELRILKAGEQLGSIENPNYFSLDNNDPTITAAVTADNDSDGYPDRIIVTINDDPDGAGPAVGSGMSTCDTDGWTITADNATVLTVNNCTVDSATQVTLEIAEDTTNFLSDNTPQVAYTQQGDSDTSDAVGNELATGSVNATDGAAPAIIEFEYKDTDANGKIDRITVNFSETLDAASVLGASDLLITNNGDFTGAVFGAGADLIAGAVSTIDIDLGTEATVVDTSEDSGSFAISTQAGFSLVDASANTNTTTGDQAHATYTDSAAPVLVSAKFTDTDEITLVFSEAVTAVGGDFTNLETATGNGDLSVSGIAGDTTDTIVITTNEAIITVDNDAGELDIAVTVTDTSAANNAFAGVANQAITDGILPTFVSAEATSDTNIRVTFSEDVTVTNADGSDFTSSGGDFTVTAATSVGGDATKVDLTIDSLADTAFTSTDLDIAQGAVTDQGSNSNEIAAIADQAVTDGQAPTVTVTVSNDPANANDDTTITVTMSEDVSGGVAPQIAIDQQGTNDLAATAFDSGNGITYTYAYDVEQHDGVANVDGTATITITLGEDSAGNTMAADSSTTFEIETVTVNSYAVDLSSNTPQVSDNITITGSMSANTGNVNAGKLLFTRVSNGNTCEVNLAAGDASKGFAASTDSIEYIADLGGIACDLGAIAFVADETYTVALLGQDSVVNNWEAADIDNTKTFTVIAAGDTTAPLFTVAPTVTTQAQTTLEVTFTPNENGTARIEYGLTTAYGSATTWESVTAATSKAITFTGLECGTAYQYKVTIRDAAGNETSSTGDSAQSTAACSADVTAPVLSLDSETPAANAAVLQFDITEVDSTNVDVWVEYGTTTDYGLYTATVQRAVGNDKQVYISGLECGTTYNYKIFAKDESANVGTYGNDTFDTSACSPDVTAPVLSLDSETPAANAVLLQFDITEAGSTNVDMWVEFGTTTDYGEYTASMQRAVGNDKQIYISNLECGTTYNYKIFAKDESGNVGTYGNDTFDTSACSADTTAPVISLDAAVPGQTTSLLQFDVTEAGSTNVDVWVEYGTTTNYGQYTATVVRPVGNDNQVYLSGLVCATTYNYKVYNKDETGNVGTSANDTFTTTACADTTPPVFATAGPTGSTTDNTPTIYVTLAAGDNDGSATCKYASSPFLFASAGTAMAWSGTQYEATVGSTLTDGTHMYYIICQDATGNETTMLPVAFTLDTSGNFDYVQDLVLNWNLLWIPPDNDNNDWGLTSNQSQHVLDATNFSSGTENWEVFYHHVDGAWEVCYGPNHPSETPGDCSDGSTAYAYEMKQDLENPFWIKMNGADRFQLS